MEKSFEDEHPHKVFGFAARDTSGLLSPFNFSRRATGPKDASIRILYCGVCHSDLHFIRNEFGSSVYPMVPGFEIVGIVTEVGNEVKNFKVGDKAAIGCMVGGCDVCDDCKNGWENDCPKIIQTYNSIYHDGTRTYGGYSDNIVVEEHYVLKFPKCLPMDAGAPLLCAGITVYSPMKYYGLSEPGSHLGVVGLGGLGHIAVKFAKAFGAKVTVISTSPSKEKEAIEKLGADAFLVSRDLEQMKVATGTLDNILDTVSAVHPLDPLLSLLKSHGKLVMAGAPEKPLELNVFSLLSGRKLVAGSCAGGMKETQEMLDFAGEHNITADIELIPMNYINTAMDRLAKGDVKYRFVIDVANTLKA